MYQYITLIFIKILKIQIQLLQRGRGVVSGYMLHCNRIHYFYINYDFFKDHGINITVSTNLAVNKT